MKAESLAWDDRFKYHSMAASVLKESQFKPQTNLLSQISAGFEVTPTGGKVSNATAFFKGQKAGQKLEFTGGWRRGDHLIGKVRIGTRPWVPVEVGHLRGQVIN
jgi:hypothetical protein